MRNGNDRSQDRSMVSFRNNCVRHRDPLLRSSLMRDSSMRSIGLEPPAETPSGTASAFEPRLCSSQKLPHEDWALQCTSAHWAILCSGAICWSGWDFLRCTSQSEDIPTRSSFIFLSFNRVRSAWWSENFPFTLLVSFTFT